MTDTGFPVGLAIDVTYPAFQVALTLLSDEQLQFEIKEGPFARTEIVDIEVIPLGNGIYALSWTEASGATVTNIQDFDRNIVHSMATLPDGRFLRMTGTLTIGNFPAKVTDHRPWHNKALVLEAMTSLFQRHDASAVKRLYKPHYIQHNPHIPQGRDALEAIVAGLSPDVFYEPGLMIAEGDLVAIHGRIRGWSEEAQVVIDIFRIEDGMLAEHWDVLQNEVPVSVPGGVSMFDPAEGTEGGGLRPD